MKRHPTYTGNARAMRHDPTPAESRLWDLVRNGRIGGFKFRRQFAVEPYIVDFVCLSAKLVVELDGDAHLGRGREDRTRDADLRAQGYEILRFPNSDVFYTENRVIEAILRACQSRAQTS